MSDERIAALEEKVNRLQLSLSSQLMEKDLDHLITHYGSDKHVNKYTPIYHALFKNMRDKPITMLEVGIGTLIPDVQCTMQGFSQPGYKPGGSLRAWRDYFPKGRFYGADIQYDTQFSEDRIKTFISDSTNRTELDTNLGNLMFDIIIDDGCHFDGYQVMTLENLWHRVKPGGFYIVEDLQVSSFPTMDAWTDKIQSIVGDDGLIFNTERRNICVISRR
jgi:hypothetical protein